MKLPRDVMTDKNKRVVRAANRPEWIPRDQGVLFHDTGSSGWRRRWDHRYYKAGRSEHNFADQHHKFFDPAVDTLE
jgi:hypothetical protein